MQIWLFLWLRTLDICWEDICGGSLRSDQESLRTFRELASLERSVFAYLFCFPNDEKQDPDVVDKLLFLSAVAWYLGGECLKAYLYRAKKGSWFRKRCVTIAQLVPSHSSFWNLVCHQWNLRLMHSMNITVAGGHIKQALKQV